MWTAVLPPHCKNVFRPAAPALVPPVLCALQGHILQKFQTLKKQLLIQGGTFYLKSKYSFAEFKQMTEKSGQKTKELGYEMVDTEIARSFVWDRLKKILTRL